MRPKSQGPTVAELRAPEALLARLKERATQLITEADLLTKLKQGRPLRVKLGVDPTAPDIHLGISVVLWKLRQFQDLGHQAVLIVGDFTARIGDPSGRSATRPVLSAEAIARNMESYREQVFKILDPQRTEFRYNSEWLAPLSFEDLLKLTSRYTVARLLERDDFSARFKVNNPISVLEFLYPLAQAYDSVAVQADVELGGDDQLFNLLAGRDIQERYGQEPQIALVTPLLEGTDGVKKMSKSYGNYIGITEPPHEIYGKLMSIPDALTEKYIRLLTDLDWDKMRNLHAMEQKKRLAWEIVNKYHNADAAENAAAEFEQVIQRGQIPTEITMTDRLTITDRISYTLRGPDGHIKEVGLPVLSIIDVLARKGLVSSKSEAKRLTAQGGIRIDGEKVTDLDGSISVKEGSIVQIGKRKFLKLSLEDLEKVAEEKEG